MTIDLITNQPFTSEDADRLLGLADQFLEDWEDDDGKDAESKANCAERRAEWDAIRPLLAQAPAMATTLHTCLATMQSMRNQIDQMRGLFLDDDGTIQAACDAHDGAATEAQALLIEAPPSIAPLPPLQLTVGQNRYHVGWEIDIWADTPREAAGKALALHQKPDSTATVFAVTDEAGDEVTIDLLDEVPS